MVESGVKHHNPNPFVFLIFFPTDYINHCFVYRQDDTRKWTYKPHTLTIISMECHSLLYIISWHASWWWCKYAFFVLDVQVIQVFALGTIYNGFYIDVLSKTSVCGFFYTSIPSTILSRDIERYCWNEDSVIA
jgi:hypothetical protein